MTGIEILKEAYKPENNSRVFSINGDSFGRKFRVHSSRGLEVTYPSCNWDQWLSVTSGSGNDLLSARSCSFEMTEAEKQAVTPLRIASALITLEAVKRELTQMNDFPFPLMSGQEIRRLQDDLSTVIKELKKAV